MERIKRFLVNLFSGRFTKTDKELLIELLEEAGIDETLKALNIKWNCRSGVLVDDVEIFITQEDRIIKSWWIKDKLNMWSRFEVIENDKLREKDRKKIKSSKSKLK